MTFAPREAAMSAVRSVEPLSTTIISSTYSGMARKTRSIPASSFRQGMMTVIDWPLYMRLCGRLFGRRGRHNGTGNHEFDQASLAPPGELRHGTKRRRPGDGPHGVHAAYGPWARAVPGQRADHRTRLHHRHRPENGRRGLHGPCRGGSPGEVRYDAGASAARETCGR